MAVEIANAVLNITPSMRGLSTLIDREIRGVDTRRAGAAAGDDYSTGFGSAAKKLTGLLAGAFAAVKVGDFAKDAIGQASDLNEVSTKLVAVFGDATGQINDFGKTGAKSLGQSNLAAKNAAAGFGVFGKAAGLANKDNASFSTNLAQLATDMASFSNTSVEQATEALSAGLRGETEPLRAYGVLLDDASLRQEALAQGLVTTTKDALTPQQKVLAANALIFKQTADAQGDFARTSGGLANQQRILAAQWEDSKGKLGQVFLPAVTGVVTALNDRLFPALETASTKATDAWGVLSTGDFKGGTSLGEEDSPLVNALFFARDAFTTVKDTLNGAWSILAHGDFQGGLGVEEDSPLVSALFNVRDVFAQVKPGIEEAWSILAGGDFKGGKGFEEDSPFVDFMFNLRDIGLDVFSKIKDIWDQLWATGEKLWPSLVSIGESLFEAWQTINNSGWSVFSIAIEALGVAFDAVGWVVDNTLVPAFDWLARFFRENPAEVYILVGAFTAWKVITLAIAAGQWAIQAATKAWAVAQGILNAVMDANPITLVIVALAALAAGIVWAYNNVDWFREIVDKSWEFIKEKSMWLWEKVLQPVFQWIGENIHVVGDFFTWLWKDIISPAWEGISAVITWAWDNIIKPYFGFIWDIVTTVGNVYLWLWNEVVSPVFQWIGGAISGAWTNVIQPVFGWLSTGISGVGTFFSDLWTTVSNVWTWIGDKIQGIWDDVISPIWEGLKGFIEGVGAFFSGIWDGVKNAVSEVKGFIDDITKAIDDFFGKVADQAESQGLTTGQQTTAGPFSSAGNPLAGMGTSADGGIVPGYNPGVDSYPYMLSGGEAVMRPEWTRAVGVQNINTWNAAARQGKLASGGVAGLHAMGGMTGSVISKASKDLLELKKLSIQQATEQIIASMSSANVAEFNSSQNPSTFGWARAANIRPYSFQGFPFPAGVAGGTEGLWNALLSALVPQIPGGLMAGGNWGFENRDNVNSPGNASFHSYGLALDVNAPANPNGAPGYGRSGQYVIPSGPAHSLAAQYGMEWGGDFSGTPDPMHFEIHLPPGAITTAATGVASSTGYDPNGGWEQWRSTVLQGLSLIGQPAALANTVLNQIRTESSGNPRAINLTDSNAQAGHPSKGLIQAIDSTFNAYRLPGLSADVYDPLSNIVAGMRYAIDRYGSIANGMRGVAYDNGGWLMPNGAGVNLLNKPEAVLTPAQSNAYIQHAKAVADGFAGQMPTLVINLDSSDPLQVAVGQMLQDAFDGAEFELDTIGARRL